MSRWALPLTLVVLVAGPVRGHAQGPPEASPVLSALRVADSDIDIDGRLSESIWSEAPFAGGFTQRDPVDGAAASEATEVRVLVSNEAVYVGVRAFDGDPSGIVGRLTRRDNIQESDAVTVYFDSFHDRLTAFQFSVTPRGAIADRYSANDGSGGDASWDPVWSVATSIDDEGWVAEFRIPLTQLRFAADQSTWGFQVRRQIQRKNEDAYWAPYSKAASGFTSLFGELRGLTDLPQPARLEIRPYVVAEARHRPPSTGSTYAPTSSTGGNVGVDLKYGLTSDFTLDVTVNPDFGQVEADPAVVNLSAFESFFPERRAFFVEGAALFNQFTSNGRFFYSRRIGRSPQGWSAPPEGGTAEVPEASTILGAAKITGKTSGGLGLGLLSAVTTAEGATLRDSTGTVVGSARVQPWVHHFAGRVEQDFGDGRHTLGTMVTALNRFDGADELNLRRAAYGMKVDGRHRWRRNRYSLEWFVLGTHIRGAEEAMFAAQRSSQRYFQRPDADHVAVDSARTSLSGYELGLSGGKNAGTWRFYGWVDRTSPGSDITDLGFQFGSVDTQSAGGGLVYRRATPLGPFRDFQLNTSEWSTVSTTDWEPTSTWFRPIFFIGNLGNNWGFNVNPLAIEFARRSINALRGGPSLRLNTWHNSFANLFTDGRKPLAASVGVSAGGVWGTGSLFGNVSAGLTARPNATLTARLNLNYNWNHDPEQWVTRRTIADSTRYVLAMIRQKTLNTNVRLDWTLSPNLSFQLYAQPFVSAGEYSEYVEVVDPNAEHWADRFHRYDGELSCTPTECEIDRDLDGAADASFSRPDFNVKSLRMTSVLRWEYRPGSVLYLALQHGRADYGVDGAFGGLGALSDLLALPSDNTVLVKVSYWLDL